MVGVNGGAFHLNASNTYRPMHIYAARCGTIRFLLHAEQANFLYLVHLGDFFPAVFSKLTKYLQITAKVTRIVKIITYN